MLVPGSPLRYEPSVDKVRTKTTLHHADSRFRGSPKQAPWNGLSKNSMVGMKPRDGQKPQQRMCKFPGMPEEEEKGGTDSR